MDGTEIMHLFIQNLEDFGGTQFKNNGIWSKGCGT